MNDYYDHRDSNLIYVVENIIGPQEISKQFEELVTNFNSQISLHCKCKSSCKINCLCVIKSGGTNYVANKDCEDITLKLNYEKNDFTIKPILECNSFCQCNENCGNRLVQKGPVKDLILKPCDSKEKGLGLYSANFIPSGSFICEYAGEVITKEQALTRLTKNKIEGKMNYIYCLNEHCNGKVLQTFVDPSKFGNIGRYINHSCEPNCFVIPVRVDSPVPKLAVFSCEDIFPNSEITFDYGAQNVEEMSLPPNDRKKCECKSKNCKGWMPFDLF